ncbi:FH1/FH2 domain-containing protein 3 [Anabrus simplex]|uniref:FH1/FH2 domain-containing protein 3 n=1 Tax=Anabrus simplex TaxID=316456 RepID=UPI0035A2F2CC
MRALAPVTNLFKMRQDVSESKSNESIPDTLHRTGSNTSLSKSSDKEDAKRTDDEKPKKNRIRHIESGERAWWLDKNSDVPEGILRIQSNKSIAKLAEAVAELQKSDSKSRLRNQLKKQESGERAWWLDSNANIPEGIQKIMSNSSLNQTTDSDSEKKKLPGLNKVKSSRSVARMQENGSDKPSLYRIRHQQSGEKAWWLCSSGNIPEGVVRLETSSSDEESSSSETEHGTRKDIEKQNDENSIVPKFPLTIPESTSRKGSTGSVKNIAAEVPGNESGRQSPYDNVTEQIRAESEKKQASPAKKASRPKHLPLFISSHTNIDDILGTAATLVEPAMGVAKLKRMLENKDAEPSDDEDLDGQSSGCEEVDATQVRIHDSTAKKPSIKQVGNITGDAKRRQSSGMIKLDDTALQLYKDGDYGSYLDLEASINEQHEEFEGFQDNRKNSIVLRTQLSVRVHTIIEKLLNSEGRELRRALFSLKQIFQEDKDLVHEFVQNDGLACLIKVGSEADQNYQNYILRALGQVMLYVDGMNGVMEHNQTVQWLYTLIASKYRLVVKTALKLLLVFVEYTEANCLLLIKAVHAVDTSHGLLPWSNIMKLLKDYDAADTELLIYATTLVNKTLNGIPDQDTYYDQVDALEEQGIEGAIQRYMSKQGTDLDLLRQLQIYEAVLHHEDGEEKGTPLKQLDETIRKTLRNRKSLNESVSTERRKSRRHSTGTSPLSSSLNNSTRLNNSSLHTSTVADDEETESSSSRSSPVPGEVHLNGNHREGKGDVGVTPALRRRRERAERQRSFIREQQETAATLKATLGNTEDDAEDENQKHSRIGNGSLDSNDIRTSNKLQLNRVSSRKDMTPLMNAVNSAESESKAVDSNGILKKPWVLSMMYGKNADGSENGEVEESKPVTENGTDDGSERKKLLQLKRENTVKDLTQKLASQNILSSPVDEGNNKINRIGDMTGLISKAKEGLAKSKSKADIAKSPTGENVPKVLEVKKSETELHWEELVQAMKRPLSLCDLDFTDLNSEDEVDILSPATISNGGPPPPPPVPMAPGMPRSGAPPPPPPVSRFSNVTAPPPFPPSANNISPAFGINLRNNRNNSTTTDSSTNKSPTSPVKKTKKTVKLFWKEVRDDPIILAKLQKTGMIWDELNPVAVDTQKLEHLFESRAKDLITKKQQEMNKNKEIIVLDHKRSNAINIGMTKLPPPRSIKTAILKMDATIMNREGIEKLLTMLPTEEERSKIQEAQMANPDLPLGSAEQFLLTLASISELPARLKLWAFKLDYENSEKEIAEPLMDLKQGMETLKANKTFRGILSTLLSIGIFLNGNEVNIVKIEYLAKVPEVKDTVHKHSLLHHLCHMVMEKFPDSSDLYSEIGAVTRASKVDFDELSANIVKMEQECKASWDHLKVIAKHDGSTMMKVKMSDFLADCAERIIVLGIVHRRVMNRFHKFLLWLGIPLHRVLDMKPNEFCRIVSEFSLEYRTTRERVLQQLEKKANHRERNKTRGKMITEVGKFRTKEDRADAELRQLLGSDISDAESIHGTLPWRRQRKDLGRTTLGPLIKDETVNGNLTDGDDEILESLVKTATKAPATRTTPRERKRTRHADRKSLKRSRTRENNTLEGSRESP